MFSKKHVDAFVTNQSNRFTLEGSFWLFEKIHREFSGILQAQFLTIIQMSFIWMDTFLQTFKWNSFGYNVIINSPDDVICSLAGCLSAQHSSRIYNIYFYLQENAVMTVTWNMVKCCIWVINTTTLPSQKVLPKLKSLLQPIPQCRQLHYDNSEYRCWSILMSCCCQAHNCVWSTSHQNWLCFVFVTV